MENGGSKAAVQPRNERHDKGGFSWLHAAVDEADHGVKQGAGAEKRGRKRKEKTLGIDAAQADGYIDK